MAEIERHHYATTFASGITLEYVSGGRLRLAGRVARANWDHQWSKPCSNTRGASVGILGMDDSWLVGTTGSNRYIGDAVSQAHTFVVFFCSVGELQGELVALAVHVVWFES